jgi:hypothetical protein
LLELLWVLLAKLLDDLPGDSLSVVAARLARLRHLSRPLAWLHHLLGSLAWPALARAGALVHAAPLWCLGWAFLPKHNSCGHGQRRNH